METLDTPVDAITAGLQREDARLRRLHMKLAAVPVAVGLAVTAAAFWGVEQAQEKVVSAKQAKAALDAEITTLNHQRAQLEASILGLNHALADKQELLNSFEAKLPARDREEASLIDKGLDLARKGESLPAIAAYKEALQINPRSELAHNWLGEAYLRTDQHGAAIKSLQKAVALDPGFADAHYNLGFALWAANQRDAAVAAFKKAFALDPTLQARAYSEPSYQRIRTFVDQRDAADSARSEDEKKWIRDGLAAAKRGRMTDAISAYGEALRINPQNALVRNWLGYAYYRNGQYPEAIDSLRSAIEIRPEYPEALYNLGLALWRDGQREAAAESLKKAFALDHNYEGLATQDPQSRAIRDYLRRKS